MEDDPAITLIGTGHVFQISDAIRDAIEAIRPDVVFVELDPGRMQALLQRRAGAPPPTGGTWLHKRLQRFQEEIASDHGTQAGEEMLAAVDGAQRIGARVGLVDRPVDITLRRALKELTIRERMRAVGMAAGGALRGLWPLGKGGANIEQEMANYNEDPEGALDELAKSFPTVRRVVIDERDEWMATRIRRALGPGQRGVAVVGDGHVPGMTRILADLEPKVYRLPDVREGRLPKPDPNDPNMVSFSFEVE